MTHEHPQFPCGQNTRPPQIWCALCIHEFEGAMKRRPFGDSRNRDDILHDVYVELLATEHRRTRDTDWIAWFRRCVARVLMRRRRERKGAQAIADALRKIAFERIAASWDPRLDVARKAYLRTRRTGSGFPHEKLFDLIIVLLDEKIEEYEYRALYFELMGTPLEQPAPIGAESSEDAVARQRANRRRYDQIRARVSDIRKLTQDTVPIWLEAAELAAESYSALDPDPDFPPERRRRYLRRVVVDLGIMQQTEPLPDELHQLSEEFLSTKSDNADSPSDQKDLQRRRLRELLKWIKSFELQAQEKLGRGKS